MSNANAHLGSVPKGTTSKIAHIFIESSLLPGTGLTGLVFNTASLTAYYIRPGDSGATAITLVTATIGTWASGGFREVDSTNAPGLYEVGIPNACLATGANSVTLELKGAANMFPCVVTYELTSTSNQNGQTGGMTALPNANAGANGGIIINSSNSGTVTLSALVVSGGVNINSFDVATTTSFNDDVSLGSALNISGTTTFTGPVFAANATNNITGIDVTRISGDGPAADNLETMLDGTGGGSLTIGNVSIASTGAPALTVESTGNDAAVFSGASGGGDGNGLILRGNGVGNGLQITGGDDSGDGMVCIGGAGGSGATFTRGTGGDAGLVINSATGSTGAALKVLGTSSISGASTLQNLSAAAVAMNSLTVSGTTTLTLAANTITASSIAAGAITSAKFAAGAITATVIATDAIDADAIAADAVAEIAVPVLAKLPPALIGNRIDATVGAMQANTLTASALATDAVNEITAATDVVITASHGAGLYTKSSSSGSGAFIVTVTVLDQSDVPIPGANVRLIQGIGDYVAQADGTGVASFSLDAGPYDRAITKSGYTFTPDSITVTDSENFDANMTAIVIPNPPSDPDKCLIFGYLIDTRTGFPAPNVALTATLTPALPSYAGGIIVGYERSGVSDSTGYVTLEVTQNQAITPPGSQWILRCQAASIASTQTLNSGTFNLSTIITG